MKIKKWLILSHVFVMVIPLIIIYFLYNTLIDYRQGMNFAEYIKSSSTIEKYEHKVKNPNLYLKPPDKYKILSIKEKHNVIIELYDKHGIVLYSSSDNNYYDRMPNEELYNKLYDMDVNYGVYTLKKPVFYKNEIVGFYKISFIKEKLISNVNNRSILIYFIFVCVYIATLIVALSFINRKINKPIKSLIGSMKSFGKQKEYLIAAIAHDLRSPLQASADWP